MNMLMQMFKSRRIQAYILEMLFPILGICLIVFLIVVSFKHIAQNEGLDALKAGTEYFNRGQFKEAKEEFQRGIDKGSLECQTYHTMLLLMDGVDSEKAIEDSIKEAKRAEENDEVNILCEIYEREQMLLACAELEQCLNDHPADMSYTEAANINGYLNNLFDKEKKCKTLEPLLVNRARIAYCKAEAYYRLMIMWQWQKLGGWRIDETKPDSECWDVVFDDTEKNVYIELFSDAITSFFEICHSELTGLESGGQILSYNKFKVEVDAKTLTDFIDDVMSSEDGHTTVDFISHMNTVHQDYWSHLSFGYEDYEGQNEKKSNGDSEKKDEEKSNDDNEEQDKQKNRLLNLYNRGFYLLGCYFWHFDALRESAESDEMTKNALDCWNAAAYLGNGDALEQLSEIYWYGIERYCLSTDATLSGYKKNAKNAEQFATVAADTLDIAHAHTILARISLSSSQNGTEENIRLSYEEVQKALLGGDPYAYCLFSKSILGLDDDDWKGILSNDEIWNAVDAYEQKLMSTDNADMSKFIMAKDNGYVSSPYYNSSLNGYALAHIGEIYSKDPREDAEQKMINCWKESTKKGCELGAYKLAQYYSGKDDEKSELYQMLAKLLRDIYHLDVDKLQKKELIQ